MASPQVVIYETGMLDSRLLGGNATSGKLHAKFVLGATEGFVGTSDFDTRTKWGCFFVDPGLRGDLLEVFEELKATSHRWSPPEWLEMRPQLMDGRNKKVSPARKQRIILKSMRGLGIEYLM